MLSLEVHWQPTECPLGSSIFRSHTAYRLPHAWSNPRNCFSITAYICRQKVGNEPDIVRTSKRLWCHEVQPLQCSHPHAQKSGYAHSQCVTALCQEKPTLAHVCSHLLMGQLSTSSLFGTSSHMVSLGLPRMTENTGSEQGERLSNHLPYFSDLIQAGLRRANEQHFKQKVSFCHFEIWRITKLFSCAKYTQHRLCCFAILMPQP